VRRRPALPGALCIRRLKFKEHSENALLRRTSEWIRFVPSSAASTSPLSNNSIKAGCRGRNEFYVRGRGRYRSTSLQGTARKTNVVEPVRQTPPASCPSDRAGNVSENPSATKTMFTGEKTPCTTINPSPRSSRWPLW
jgi:hypothetical protein